MNHELSILLPTMLHFIRIFVLLPPDDGALSSRQHNNEIREYRIG
jgi:hypothetical protein